MRQRYFAPCTEMYYYCSIEIGCPRYNEIVFFIVVTARLHRVCDAVSISRYLNSTVPKGPNVSPRRSRKQWHCPERGTPNHHRPAVRCKIEQYISHSSRSYEEKLLAREMLKVTADVVADVRELGPKEYLSVTCVTEIRSHKRACG